MAKDREPGKGDAFGPSERELAERLELTIKCERFVYWLSRCLSEAGSGGTLADETKMGAAMALASSGYTGRRIEAMLMLGEPGTAQSELRPKRPTIHEARSLHEALTQAADARRVDVVDGRARDLAGQAVGRIKPRDPERGSVRAGVAIVLAMVLGFVALMLAGCGALFNSSTTTVSVRSNVPGATIAIDGEAVGETPDDVQLTVNREHVITISKVGHETRSCRIGRSIGGAWVILDVLGGLLPLIIDAASGAWYELDVEHCWVNLPVSAPGGGQ